MTAKLLQDLTWGDGSNDKATRGFIEASIQQAAREWQRGASPRANREKAASRIALDFLARNLGLWKNENNHWVLHDSLAEICTAIFLEQLGPAETSPSFFWMNAHNWITTNCCFLGGEQVDVYAQDGFLTDRRQAYESVCTQTAECSFPENFLRRCAEDAAHTCDVSFIGGEFRTTLSVERDRDVLRIVNAMLLFYGMALGACRLQDMKGYPMNGAERNIYTELGLSEQLPELEAYGAYARHSLIKHKIAQLQEELATLEAQKAELETQYSEQFKVFEKDQLAFEQFKQDEQSKG